MKNTIAVVGQCRTGTSMTMQMLAAAGLNAAGEAPAYEDRRVWVHVHPVWGWWEEYDAVKFVDPHVLDLESWFHPDNFAKLIVCRRRDHKQQAKSIKKFLTASGMYSGHRPGAFLRDIKKAQAWYNQILAGGALELVFEDTLRNPRQAAEKLCKFIGCGDPEKVAAVVVARDPRCYKGMLELELVEQLERQA